MARERITFPVNLRQNTNDDSTAFGKWFPVPSTSEPMSLKGFAKHLSEHGKLASYDMLVLVLQNIVSCLKELILQGQSLPVRAMSRITSDWIMNAWSFTGTVYSAVTSEAR